LAAAEPFDKRRVHNDALLSKTIERNSEKQQPGDERQMRERKPSVFGHRY
jgi:hypothetical protein